MTPAPEIVHATSPADVRAAVLAARSRGERVAVRATGHGTFAEPSPGTLLIDTSGMRSVLVDPVRRIARVGPGATAGALIAAAAPFGLAPVTGTSATVGVAGFTFGGGHGFLSRLYGLAADSLLRADVVTADGEALTACRDRCAAPVGTSPWPRRSRSGCTPSARSSAAARASTAGWRRTCSPASASTRCRRR
jgi:FAD/FMN-containing dehydrogenase